MSKQKTALIDGDVIRYQVGFATQRNIFIVNGHEFLTKNEAETYCVERAIPNHNITKVVRADFRQAVFHTVDMFLKRIMEEAGASEMRIFLTGTGNYREALATIQPYKGGRLNDKPIHFEAITKYLLIRYKAEVINGAEADDALGYSQTDSTVICTVDKDLDMIPGDHYNWKRDTKYTVEHLEGMRFFYYQLLTGDSIDNIAGCIGIGDKTAKAALEDCKTEREMYGVVRDLYMMQYSKFADRHGATCHMITDGKFGEAVMRDLVENANLLWIQREKGVLWKVPEAG